MNPKRFYWILVGLLVLAVALAACQPEPEEVEVTRVVTETQEVEVEVPVEVTRVVTEVTTETVTETVTEIVEVHAELLRVGRVEGVLCVDERRRAPTFLRLRHHRQPVRPHHLRPQQLKYRSSCH